MGEVLNFFSRVRNSTELNGGASTQQAQTEQAARRVDFLEIAQKNASVQDKLRKERAEANQNVLKSYRIK